MYASYLVVLAVEYGLAAGRRQDSSSSSRKKLGGLLGPPPALSRIYQDHKHWLRMTSGMRPARTLEGEYHRR